MKNYKPSQDITPILLNGKQVAVLRGNLLDIRKHREHFLYLKDDAAVLQRTVCIANETLRLARHASIVQVTDLDNKVRFTISRADFDKHSFEWHTPGWDVQRACYLKYFASTAPHQKNYPVSVQAEPLRFPSQLPLFST